VRSRSELIADINELEREAIGYYYEEWKKYHRIASESNFRNQKAEILREIAELDRKKCAYKLQLLELEVEEFLVSPEADMETAPLQGEQYRPIKL
jgi:hypothetical protein